VRLGWLIDLYQKKVHVYRANGEIEILENTARVSGEDVLHGFELDWRKFGRLAKILR
jgi:Uma2 family endonuclease